MGAGIPCLSDTEVVQSERRTAGSNSEQPKDRLLRSPTTQARLLRPVAIEPKQDWAAVACRTFRQHLVVYAVCLDVLGECGQIDAVDSLWHHYTVAGHNIGRLLRVGFTTLSKEDILIFNWDSGEFLTTSASLKERRRHSPDREVTTSSR